MIQVLMQQLIRDRWEKSDGNSVSRLWGPHYKMILIYYLNFFIYRINLILVDGPPKIVKLVLFFGWR